MAVDLMTLSRGARERVLAALDAYNNANEMVRALQDDGIAVVLGQDRAMQWEIVQIAIVDPERHAKRPERRPPAPAEPEPTEEDLDVGIDIGQDKP